MSVRVMPRYPDGSWKCACGEPKASNINYCNGCNSGPEAQRFLIDLLVEALPYVEESEQFNKPSCRTLSKRIKAAIERRS